jgi:hypothetical protein
MLYTCNRSADEMWTRSTMTAPSTACSTPSASGFTKTMPRSCASCTSRRETSVIVRASGLAAEGAGHDRPRAAPGVRCAGSGAAAGRVPRRLPRRAHRRWRVRHLAGPDPRTRRRERWWSGTASQSCWTGSANCSAESDGAHLSRPEGTAPIPRIRRMARPGWPS